MIGRILGAARSARVPLDYNERKVNAGDAQVIGCANLPDDLPSTIYETVDRYERNIAVSRRTVRFGFHLTIDPDVRDEIAGDDNRIRDLACELMEGLGYGDQPYVIYRHNDIDREHYHVVSVRVGRDGKAIDDSFEGLVLLSLLRSLAPKYGYTVGREMEEREDVKPAVLLPESADKAARVRANFKEALKYDFTNFTQFRMVLETMGVAVRIVERDDRRSLWFAARGADGRRASAGMSEGRALKEKAWEKYVSRFEENRARARSGAEDPDRDLSYLRMMAVFDYGIAHAESLPQFEKMLSECGVSVCRKDSSLTFIDAMHHRVASQRSLGPGYDAGRLDSTGWTKGPKITERQLSDADYLVILNDLKERLRKLKEQRERKRLEGQSRNVGRH